MHVVTLKWKGECLVEQAHLKAENSIFNISNEETYTSAKCTKLYMFITEANKSKKLILQKMSQIKVYQNDHAISND